MFRVCFLLAGWAMILGVAYFVGYKLSSSQIVGLATAAVGLVGVVILVVFGVAALNHDERPPTRRSH